MTLRSAFSKAVIDLMARDDKIAVLLGDIGIHAFREAFAKWPERTINCGVAECGMVGMAAGLSMAGFYPVVSTIDAFLVRRAYEFIYLDFGLQGLPGLFVTVGGAQDYARLGGTHQCHEGLTLMSEVRGMHLRQPTSEARVREAITDAVAARSLCYIRLEESLVVAETDNVIPLTLGAKNGHAIPAGADG